ncbi:hypothetical protein HDU98_004304 [Podochytrium sp. JEL0797]|nr:hypothetical protein HDU98_004304 [Podochytrium sp. JEL0797]
MKVIASTPATKHKPFIYATFAIVLVCVFTVVFLQAQILTKSLAPLHSPSNTTTASSRTSPIAATTTAPGDKHSPLPTTPTAKTYPHLALALKTGAETAASRSAIQLLTFLQDAANVLVIAEAPGVKIGGVDVEDMYSGVYDRIEEKMRKEGKERRGDAVEGGTAESMGWQLDAHKNLPGFQLLHERFPDAEWYIMFDDDAYVLLDNYAAHLATLNPDDEWYLGQPNVFAGCDGVTNFGDGPLFAQGGAGIVISRGAMKKMVPVLDKCILKYRDCWAGDVRVALCMRDSGVLITQTDQLYQSPPNSDFEYPDTPCTEPLVFHKTLPHQIQSLYDAQRATPFNRTTFADSYHHMHFNNTLSRVSGDLRIRKDAHIAGAEREKHETESAESCLSVCESIKDCVAWTWREKECVIKYGPGRLEGREGMWGGVLAERYRCEK